MSELAKRYAQALFSLRQDEPRLQKDTELLTGTPALWAALKNPCIPTVQKNAVLERLLGKETGPLFLNFYKLLCERGRIALLPDIAAAYHRCALDSENTAEAWMRCVIPPPEGQKEALCAALCRRHGKTRVNLHIVEDPSLMGGFVLEIGGVAYDRSIRGLFRNMRRDFGRGEWLERKT